MSKCSGQSEATGCRGKHSCPHFHEKRPVIDSDPFSTELVFARRVLRTLSPSNSKLFKPCVSC